MKIPAPFPKETDLCAAFIAEIGGEWVAYNETFGWDILLVHKTHGWQIGVQAKLRLIPEVLRQAAESYSRSTTDAGPDYRAVLVPENQTSGLAALAPYCGITVITMRKREPYCGTPLFHPSLPSERYLGDEWHEMMPWQRCPLPEYIPDVPAGAAAPVQLTVWKIKAMKLLILLETTGYVTRADFKRFGIDIRRWIGEGAWLVPCDDGFRGADTNLIERWKRMHPRVWGEISAEPEKWQRYTTETRLL